MQAILIYLLKATICSGILFLYYYIVLRNKRFHYYNRFYLLMSVALSLLLPLLNIELWEFQSNNRQVIQLMNVAVVNTVEINADGGAFTFSWSLFIMLLYALITLLMLLFFIFSIHKLYRFKHIYPVEKLDDILFINTDLQQAPFSFFNNLFWKNTIDITDLTGRQIFKHELTHIEQKHSWDKLFLRLTTLVFWMNPFYWLIQKELGLIHEFIADEKAIENKSAEAFALVLLQSQYGKHIFSPAQSFNYSPIKRRLLMLTTSAKTSYSYVRRIMILPLLAGTIMLFAFKLKESRQQQSLVHTNTPFTLLVDAGHGGSEAGAVGINGIMEKDINLSVAKKVQALAPEYGITVKMTRTEDITMDQKMRMDVIEQAHPNAFVSIHVNTTEEPQTSKNEVSVYITRDESNANYRQSRLLGSSLLQVAKDDFPVSSTIMQRKEQGIYVIDKNPYPAIVVECGYINNADNVKQLTDAKKVEQLARAILQGVVAYANAAPETTSVVITDTSGKTPLYFVDGKEVSAVELEKIDKSKIESINVLKGSGAIKQYGERGKNGVVIINLKNGDEKNKNSTSDSVDIDLRSKTVTFPPENITIQADKILMKTDSKKQPIFFVDGKEMSKEALQKLKPNSIYSMSVLKDEYAVKKYGERGKNGLIEIITKDKHETSTSGTTFITATAAISSVTSDTTIKPESKAFQYDVSLTDPKFPGGAEAWKNYLIRNLNANLPKEQKAPPGIYTVVVSFTVDTKGNLSDVKAENDPGYGTGAEAVRVIKSGPKWIPAVLNGRATEAKTKQAITFRVEES
ncbi:hypothetical protein FC093_14455 [Ilyomonas limi]|uniref:N-acetylmuramoyl-L-alanine amidase n=1 Tax=Ilyomonas limi TaxID=2575867 RepID=A0A4U3KXZ0_9BACT|nr:N-acetylmuramoyl-L-alanine amidase [Ilyomonas limi]TKK67488.1 hypothetical protein FC093_14455 [Ilyomonas limi]